MTLETTVGSRPPIIETDRGTGARAVPNLRSPRWPALALLPNAALAGWAAVRIAGLERGVLPTQLIAFTPYVAAAAAVVFLATGAIRVVSRGRWATSALVLAAGVTLSLGACVLPRWVPASDPGPSGPGGPELRVMTANLLYGLADPTNVVRLVRERKVDLLALQEYTGPSEHALLAAGLGELLPHRVAVPLPYADGTALYSRYPLTRPGERAMPGGFVQATAVLEVPGGPPVAVETVHTFAPLSADPVRRWVRDFAVQPPATPGGQLRILLGDFNATLDHAALRRLIGTGYRDAAAVLGEGFVPTWPADGRRVPGVTIDHVLADRRIGIDRIEVRDLPNSDHRAVIADLTLPPR